MKCSRARPAKLILLALVACAAGGCISPLPYRPADDLVQRLGMAQAIEELKNSLSLASSPLVLAVYKRGEYVDYDTEVEVSPFQRERRTKRIALRSVTRVEVYPNGKTWVYQGPVLTHQFQFLSVDDAIRAADALWSFREWVRNAPSEVPRVRKPIRV